MTPNKSIDDLVEELPKKKCLYCDGDGYTVERDPRDETGQTPMQEGCDHCHAEGFITTLDVVRTALTLAYQEGRCSVLAEMNHETRQLLDGFDHPKDCEMCRPINQERV
jgi:hypothetical protein